MQKTQPSHWRFVGALLLTLGATSATLAQSPDKEQLRVKITERLPNGVREIERTYSLDGMTDDKRDALVQKLVDSLRSDGKRGQLSVSVDENRVGQSAKTRGYKRNDDRESYTFRYNDNGRNGGNWNDEDWGRWQKDMRRDFDSLDRNMNYRFRFDMDDFRNNQREWADRARRDADRLRQNADQLRRNTERQSRAMADQMRNFRFEWPRDFDRHFVQPFENWAKSAGGSSTIRSVDVYPNRPDRTQLNVRFTAPTKGDVQIRVTTPSGKEVARKELKDFSGDFLGQLELSKNAGKVVFVAITQGDDGTVRRVVLE